MMDGKTAGDTCSLLLLHRREVQTSVSSWAFLMIDMKGCRGAILVFPLVTITSSMRLVGRPGEGGAKRLFVLDETTILILIVLLLRTLPMMCLPDHPLTPSGHLDVPLECSWSQYLPSCFNAQQPRCHKKGRVELGLTAAGGSGEQRWSS